MTQFDFNLALSLYESPEEFPVNFDNAWTWLDFSRKDAGKRSFESAGFVEELDFIRLHRSVEAGAVKRNLEFIYMTVECFKMWAMMVNTSRGKEVRRIFAEDIKQYDRLKLMGLAQQEITLNTELISIHNGQLVTDSLTLAKTFNKDHKNVTRDIRSKLHSSTNPIIVDFYTKHFIECSYIDSIKREQTKYLLTREGFSLLALGFTGEQAELFKIQYIEAFEAMYKKLEGYALAHFFRDTSDKQFVYIIKNTITGLIKIGITNNMKRRINQLECATGCELETIFCSVISDNAKEIEKRLHEQFAEFRQRGEWFDVNPDMVVNAIMKLPFKLNNVSTTSLV